MELGALPGIKLVSEVVPSVLVSSERRGIEFFNVGFVVDE